MHVDALRIFCDVADTQSFTDAARLHHCTPANASHQFHSWIGLPRLELPSETVILKVLSME
jgi:hypothetical protein